MSRRISLDQVIERDRSIAQQMVKLSVARPGSMDGRLKLEMFDSANHCAASRDPKGFLVLVLQSVMEQWQPPGAYFANDLAICFYRKYLSASTSFESTTPSVK